MKTFWETRALHTIAKVKKYNMRNVLVEKGLQGTFYTELWHLSQCGIEELSPVCISEAVTPAAWRSSVRSDEGESSHYTAVVSHNREIWNPGSLLKITYIGALGQLEFKKN